MSTKAFTLAEVLIVLSIVATLAVLAIVLINPLALVQRGQDTKQKADLTTLKKVFDEWYNDKNCYPKPSEVCFDAGGVETNPCHICGTEPTSPSMPTSYILELPCSPFHPGTDFTYTVNTTSCPQSYKIYTNLGNKEDTESEKIGCADGACGPVPYYGFNYGVTSPNVSLDKSMAHCLDSGKCNSCGEYEQSFCAPCQPTYGSLSGCCEANPDACKQFHCESTVTGDCMLCGWSSSQCFLNSTCVLDSTREGMATCCTENGISGTPNCP